MQLYNIKLAKIVQIDILEDEKLKYKLSKLSTKDLKDLGFLRVKEVNKLNDFILDDEIEKTETIDDIYTITYKQVDNRTEEEKILAFKDSIRERIISEYDEEKQRQDLMWLAYDKTTQDKLDRINARMEWAKYVIDTMLAGKEPIGLKEYI